MPSVLADLRAAVRFAARRRGVSLLAIAMLAIGIGATTAMFTVMDAVLLRELPYRSPGRLVTVWQTFPHWRGSPGLDSMWNRIALSYAEYQRVSALGDDFADVGAAYWRQQIRWTGQGDPTEVSVARGSASLLPMLGIQPMLGRWFLPGEEGPAAPQLAVLSHKFWMTRFGGDPQAVGATISLADRPFVIIGVLPAEFQFVSLSPFATKADRDAIWTPIGSWSGDMTEGSQNYEIVARLKDGVTTEHARLDVARVVRADRKPEQHDAVVLSRKIAETSEASAPLVALLAAATALQAITCGNLAALLLGEGASREAEVRTRLALGASASRILRQLLAESAMLAIAGGVAGVAVAAGLSKALVALAPVDLPHAGHIGVNARVLVIAVVTSCAAAIACGLAPALSLARLGRIGAASRSVSRRRSRLQQGLIAAQIALSMSLLMASGLLARTLSVEMNTPTGFVTDRVLAISLNKTFGAAKPDAGALQRFYDEVVEKLRALPGVQAVTATSNVPIAGNAGTWAMNPDPAGKLSNGSASVQHDEVLPGFFETMGLTLLAGRTLTDDDPAGNPLVAVVNEVMARRFWPADSAIGKQFLAPNGGVRTIVGIVADIQERGLSRPPLATFYESVRQVRASHQVMLVRTAGDPMALADSARRAIWSVDPLLPVEQMTTMGQIVHESLAPERYRAALVAFFALLAAAMTTIGIAGVAMRSVAAQLRELCIRMAIGATPQHVIRIVVARYAWLAVAGVIGGGVLSLAAMRLVAAYLVGVSPRDPVTFSAVGVMILSAAALAAWLPARRIRGVSLTRELARG